MERGADWRTAGGYQKQKPEFRNGDRDGEEGRITKIVFIRYLVHQWGWRESRRATPRFLD